MRAKMQVQEVHRSGFSNGKDFVFQDRVKMTAVAAKAYPAGGADEDNTYAKFSPTGELSLTIANPDLIGKIQPGQKFYIDFTPAES
jgi:hypothetical protein